MRYLFIFILLIGCGAAGDKVEIEQDINLKDPDEPTFKIFRASETQYLFDLDIDDDYEYYIEILVDGFWNNYRTGYITPIQQLRFETEMDWVHIRLHFDRGNGWETVYDDEFKLGNAK